MKPVGMEIKRGNYILSHRCQTCGLEKRNKSNESDSFEAILAVSQKKK
jgi:hypothetical protein